jgi:hypothetical protein
LRGGRLTPFRSTSRSPISQRLPRISNTTGRLSLALLPKPLVVQSFHGVVERPQLVAAAIRDVQRVIDGLGSVSAQGDRVVGVLDQPQLNRIGDRSSSCGSFGARLVRRLHPQVLRHERRRSLIERVGLAGDLEHDLHSAEPISAMVGGAVNSRASVVSPFGRFSARVTLAPTATLYELAFWE